jgi:multiple sugar transport system substrate-binding protein
MRGKYRKALVAAVAAATVFGMVGASAASAGSARSVHPHVTTVTLWSRSATSQLPDALVPEFNKTHSDVQIKLHLTSPNDDTAPLLVALHTGIGIPDLVGLNDIDVPEFENQGLLTNMTKFYKSLSFKKALSPGHVKLATDNGQYYGVPYLADLSVLWINKKLFQEAHIASYPTTFAQMANDAKRITALSKPGKPVYGFFFPGDCQGCLGFVMLPDVWASGQHLIKGPLGHQTANVIHNAPLKALLSTYRKIWVDKSAPPNSRTEQGPTWINQFANGNIGIEPGAYGFAPANLASKNLGGSFTDVPLPSAYGPHGSTFDGGDDFVIPKGAKNVAGAEEVARWFLQKAQQVQYPANGLTPIRNDIITNKFLKKYPLDAVPLRTLKYGSVEYTLAYDQVFNEPTSPWLKMFQEAVFTGNLSNALSIGQSGIQQTLNANS